MVEIPKIQKLKISNIENVYNIHTGSNSDMYKIGLIQNIIQNPDVHL